MSDEDVVRLQIQVQDALGVEGLKAVQKGAQPGPDLGPVIWPSGRRRSLSSSVSPLMKGITR